MTQAANSYCLDTLLLAHSYAISLPQTHAQDTHTSAHIDTMECGYVLLLFYTSITMRITAPAAATAPVAEARTHIRSSHEACVKGTIGWDKYDLHNHRHTYVQWYCAFIYIYNV